MSCTIWFTGLSGAGKTTLSLRVFYELRERGLAGELLDGDIIRANFSQELGFTKRDRDINVRRIGFVSHLLNKHGVLSVVAAIAPYADARLANRTLIDNYLEIYVNCSLARCEERDVKGLYAKARAGLVPNFTGVSDPYEPPVNPEIEVRTDLENEDQSFATIMAALEERGICAPRNACQLRPGVHAEEERWRTKLAQLGFAR